MDGVMKRVVVIVLPLVLSGVAACGEESGTGLTLTRERHEALEGRDVAAHHHILTAAEGRSSLCDEALKTLADGPQREVLGRSAWPDAYHRSAVALSPPLQARCREGR